RSSKFLLRHEERDSTQAGRQWVNCRCAHPSPPTRGCAQLRSRARPRRHGARRARSLSCAHPVAWTVVPRMTKRIVSAAACALVALPGMGVCRGVTPYLPLNLEPEIEAQIERVLILAGK